jgi:hypothetical protein
VLSMKLLLPFYSKLLNQYSLFQNKYCVVLLNDFTSSFARDDIIIRTNSIPANGKSVV